MQPTPSSARGGLWTDILANVLIVGLFVTFWVLKEASPQTFHGAIQEDEALEWASFWAFIVAAGVSVVVSRRQWRLQRKVPWFAVGVGLFCAFVAMEEISWGQRVFGYRPPEYFLAENFQQEFNLHNIASTSFRKLVMAIVILGYGVALPLAALVPPAQRLMARAAVLPPPIALSPAFLVTYVIYAIYPFKYVGEVVELMLGLGFLLAALALARTLRPSEADDPKPMSRWSPLLVVLLVLALGFGSAEGQRALHGDDPAKVATATSEIEALRADLDAMVRRGRGGFMRKRGIHKRLFSYVQKYARYGAGDLEEGAFSALTQRGLPDARAEFFLDPWNNPYWVRKESTTDRAYSILMVYSFGPNRRRDSRDWEVRDDDVGVVVIEFGERPADLELDLD